MNVVLGGGLGGYFATFRSADLGKQVTLLYVARTLQIRLNKFIVYGTNFGDHKSILVNCVTGKITFIESLTSDSKRLAWQRKVVLLTGVDKFVFANQVMVATTG